MKTPPLSANFGALLPMKDRSKTIIPLQGSSYNVLVEWENGEITSETLSIIAADDPVTCAIYARDNNLLDPEGWKRFKGIAKWERSCVIWLIKPNCAPIRLHPSTSLATRYSKTLPMQFG